VDGIQEPVNAGDTMTDKTAGGSKSVKDSRIFGLFAALSLWEQIVIVLIIVFGIFCIVYFLIAQPRLYFIPV
jgi:hypothetical protein